MSKKNNERHPELDSESIAMKSFTLAQIPNLVWNGVILFGSLIFKGLF